MAPEHVTYNVQRTNWRTAAQYLTSTNSMTAAAHYALGDDRLNTARYS